VVRPADQPDAAALAWIRQQVPEDAVVQGDPVRRLDIVALTDRRAGVLDPDYAHVAVFRPADRERMWRAYKDVRQAFTDGSSESARDRLERWEVDYVLAGTVEHRRYGDLPQFADPRCFEIVYTDEAATVSRVLDQSVFAPPPTRDEGMPDPGDSE
jgi:uncharacterized membrane protein